MQLLPGSVEVLGWHALQSVGARCRAFLLLGIMLEADAYEAFDFGLLCLAFQRSENVGVGTLVKLERQTLYMRFLVTFLRCFFAFDCFHNLSTLGRLPAPPP